MEIFNESRTNPLLNLNQHIMFTRQVSWDEACFFNPLTCGSFFAMHQAIHLHRASFGQLSSYLCQKMEACMYKQNDESFDVKMLDEFI